MKKLFLLLFISLSIHAQRYALISVSDKTGVREFARQLVAQGFDIISTGGTHAHLAQAVPVEKLHQVSDITQFPELFDGRIKTLHPMIHGGILAQRSNDAHQKSMQEHGIPRVDIVVGNLYPFQNVVAHDDVALTDAIENIDIGGVALARAAAKNYHDVLIITDPSDYAGVAAALETDSVSDEMRKHFAIKAFAHTAQYDAAIADYLSQGAIQTRQYEKVQDLKYGLNPYQKQAALYTLRGGESPLQLLNGQIGFINVLDAVQSWQLVKEAREAFDLPACASFKHVSPAGVGLGVALSDEDRMAFDVRGDIASPVACAFIRARHGDPKSSFGDWIACSDTVDEQTAQLIKVEVSDGIIAPNYTPAALEILKQKKRGAYPIVQIDPDYSNKQLLEFRELFGIGLCQEPNDMSISDDLLKAVVTKNSDISAAVRDLKLALITLKYTQSNSVVYAKNGQVIGVGSGQQNRVDCVNIAGKKAAAWMLRRHPRVQSLQFKPAVRRAEKNNAIVRFISGDSIDELLQESQIPLSREEKAAFLQLAQGVSLASDAFFPFADNIEVAARRGVSYVVQPGGSMRDADIVAACDQHGIAMACSGMRLFTH